MWLRQAGRPPGPRPRLGLGPEMSGLASAAGLPPHPLPPRPPAGPLPGSRAGREKQPGAQRPRARRGQERRREGERTAARAAPTLPPESGVEHSASPSRANEEDSRGNSTTYLRARNDRVSCPRPARPWPGRSSDARASWAWGGAWVSRACTPKGTFLPKPLEPIRQPAAARRRPPALLWGSARRGTCASAPLCTLTSF